MPVSALLPHVQSMLELIQRCLADEERTDALMKHSYGLIGDLADTFPNGELKQLLLQTWLAQEMRSRHRMSADAKKTLRWAREVCGHELLFFPGSDREQVVKIATQ